MTDRSAAAVEAVASRDDLAAYVAIINAVMPDEPTSVERLDWEDATYPGIARFLARLDGVPVGAAGVGRMFVYPPEYEAFWSTIGVLPEARERGVGGRLLEALRDVAVQRDKRWLEMAVSAARPESIGFLVRRGFREIERAHMVRLDLAGLAVPDGPTPDGVTLTTLEARPELVEGVHAVAIAAFPDIPTSDEPIAAGDLAEFRARDVDQLPGWGFSVAVQTTTGRVVGYASLLERDDHSGVYWHDMTAVLPAWRGRGLARALKVATIRAAIDHGAVALETGNDVDNAPMRAVNARLGYRPLPDSITMRGPAAAGMMGG